MSGHRLGTGFVPCLGGVLAEAVTRWRLGGVWATAVSGARLSCVQAVSGLGVGVERGVNLKPKVETNPCEGRLNMRADLHTISWKTQGDG